MSGMGENDAITFIGEDGQYWAKIRFTTTHDGVKREQKGWILTRVEGAIAYIEAQGDGKLVKVPCKAVSNEWSGPLHPPDKTITRTNRPSDGDGYYWALVNVKGLGQKGWIFTRVQSGLACFEAVSEGKLVAVPCEEFSQEWSARLIAPGPTVEELRAAAYSS